MIARTALAALIELLLTNISKADWSPATPELITHWGAELKPTEAWREYPRPQMRRENGQNLNGLWDYAITQAEVGKPEQWGGKILVPFAVEASLSGVGKTVSPAESLWYRRTFPAKAVAGKRTLLHFEAVDYDCTVWLNGKELGQHKGGFTPFSFDLSPALKDGENDLVVKVRDATGGYQLHGKQSPRVHGIWCGPVTGIWQTVWLEEVPARSIKDLDLISDPGEGMIGVTVWLAGAPVAGEKIRRTASGVDQPTVTAEGMGALKVVFKEPKLWAPGAPYL